MNIILLKGVLPLRKKILLSKKFGIELDNPRSKDELSYASYFLKDRIDFKEDKKLLKYSLVSDAKAILHLNYLENALRGLLKYHKDNIYFDKSFLKNYNKQKSLDFLIKSWLIIRFDDEGFFRELRKEKKRMIKRKERGLFILEGTEVGPQREERAHNFLSILDLIFLDKMKGLLRKTIVLKEDGPELNQLWIHIIGLVHGRSRFKEFDYFSIADKIDEIIDFSQKIDNLSENQKEKLLFVGETIGNVNDYGGDSKIQFLMLVSVIEFLLTHNPDISRFNVEDSIRKQFQLKAGVVISNKNKTKLDLITQRLKVIYDIRSLIAHGNFFELRKFVRNTKKKDKDFDIFDLVEEIFNYIAVIIKTYICEPDFIESLKKI